MIIYIRYIFILWFCLVLITFCSFDYFFFTLQMIKNVVKLKAAQRGVVDKAARGGKTVLKHLEYYTNSTENSVF